MPERAIEQSDRLQWKGMGPAGDDRLDLELCLVIGKALGRYRRVPRGGGQQNREQSP